MTGRFMLEPRRTGFVDESYIPVVGGVLYVLGLAEPVGRADETRELLRDLSPARGGILHFREEDDRRKLAVAKRIAELDLRLTAVVCATEARAERARGLCVRDLAWSVRDRLRVLAFESRGPKRDRHDLSVVRGLVRQGVELDCAFPAKSDEPLLWPADFVAGAVRMARAGGSDETLRTLGCVEVPEV